MGTILYLSYITCVQQRTLAFTIYVTHFNPVETGRKTAPTASVGINQKQNANSVIAVEIVTQAGQQQTTK